MKNRPNHKWKPNKVSRRPHHVVFVDTETVPIERGTKFKEHVLKMGWCCYRSYGHGRDNTKAQWLYFVNTSTFWEFLKECLHPRKTLYLVGHNIAYDMGILQMTKTARANGWKETFYHSKALSTIISYKTGMGKLCILSTTNFYPMKLETLGELVGMSKGKVDFDTVPDQVLKDYCRRDVEITMKIWDKWIDFLDLHNMGTFQKTIASQAFTAYRHAFMNQDVFVHNNIDVCLLERSGYRGGRCEVFKTGEFPEDKYIKLDVNGMYGYAMAGNKFPLELYGHRHNVGLSFLRCKLKNYAVVAKVLVKTDLPVFPVKMRDVNCYVTGTFETVLTTPELKFALEHCEILQVREIAWYRQDYILRDYARYFSNLKDKYSKEGNMVFRKIAKLLNNALYGKLAQRNYADRKTEKPNPGKRVKGKKNPSQSLWKVAKTKLRKVWGKWSDTVWNNPSVPDYDPNVTVKRLDPWSFKELLGKKPKLAYYLNEGEKVVGTRNVTRSKGWVTPSETDQLYGESYNSFPAISAHVTAFARLHLWNLMVKAGRKNVFYTDTDGFVVNQQGYVNVKALLDDHKQGMLKIEDSSTSLTVLRRKGYQMGTKRVICGIRKNAVEVKPLVFEQDQFLGVAGAIGQGKPDLRGITRVIKRVSCEIKGGIVQGDGWKVPFEINERGEILNEGYTIKGVRLNEN